MAKPLVVEITKSAAPDGIPEGFTLDAPASANISPVPDGYKLDAIPDKREDAGKLDAFLKGAGNALTLGGIDELRAAVRAPFTDKTYDQELSDFRQKQATAADQHPDANLAGNVYGGLSGAVASGGITSTAAPAVAARLAAAPIKTALGSAIGAGTTAGFLGSEGGFDKRLGNAAVSGAISAPFGLAGGVAGTYIAAPAIKTAGSLASRAAQIFKQARGPVESVSPSVQAKSVAMVADALQKQYGPDAANILRQQIDAGQPVLQLGADQNAVNRLARGAAQYDAGSQTLAPYYEQAGSEARDAFENSVRRNISSDGFDANMAIKQTGQDAAGSSYEAAFKGPAPAGEFYQTMAGRQSVQDALAAVKKIAAEKQIPVSDMFTTVPNPKAEQITRQVPTGIIGSDGQPVMRTVTETLNPKIEVPTVRGWDQVKRELDAKITQLYRSGDTTQAAAVKETRNALRDQLAKDVPELGKAREFSADYLARDEGIAIGQKWRTLAPDQLKANLKTMSPSEKEGFLSGIAQDRMNILGKTESGSNPGSRIKLDGNDDKRLMAVLSPRDYRAHKEAVDAAIALKKQENFVLGGSPTAGKQVDRDLFNSDNSAVLQDALTQPKTTAVNLVSKFFRNTFGMGDKVAGEVAKLLTEKSPQAQLVALQRLGGSKALTPQERQLVKETFFKTQRVINPNYVGGSVGGQAGAALGTEITK